MSKPWESLGEFMGRWAIWTIKTRTHGTVRVRVRTLDADRRWGRVDVEIKTELGDRLWVTADNLELIPREDVPEGGFHGHPYGEARQDLQPEDAPRLGMTSTLPF